MATIEPAQEQKVGGKYVGKCPACDAPLARKDIHNVFLRGSHTAYVCRLCNHIIGFRIVNGHSVSRETFSLAYAESREDLIQYAVADLPPGHLSEAIKCMPHVRRDELKR